MGGRRGAGGRGGVRDPSACAGMWYEERVRLSHLTRIRERAECRIPLSGGGEVGRVGPGEASGRSFSQVSVLSDGIRWYRPMLPRGTLADPRQAEVSASNPEGGSTESPGWATGLVPGGASAPMTPAHLSVACSQSANCTHKRNPGTLRGKELRSLVHRCYPSSGGVVYGCWLSNEVHIRRGGGRSIAPAAARDFGLRRRAVLTVGFSAYGAIGAVFGKSIATAGSQAWCDSRPHVKPL